MTEPQQLVRIGAPVEKETADALRRLAESRERSIAAEIRLAVREWIDSQEREAA